MNFINRRELLKLIGRGVLAGASIRAFPGFILSEAQAEAGPGRFMIVVNLPGGLDLLGGLLNFVNTNGGTSVSTQLGVRRPGLCYNSSLIAHDGLQLAFHPEWQPLYSEYLQGHMKVLFGYGNPPANPGELVFPNLSHEYNQRLQAYGDTHFSGSSSGWLARAREVLNLSQQEVIGLGVGSGEPFVHRDPRFKPLVVESLANLTEPRILNFETSHYIGATVDEQESDRLLATARRLRELHLQNHPDATSQRLDQAFRRVDDAIEFFRPINDYNGLTGNYSNTQFGESIRGIGKVIGSLHSTPGNRILYTSFGGSHFDTHSDQRLVLDGPAGLVAQIARNLASLVGDIQRLGPEVWNNVVITTTTEFGREIGENGAAGCDHGSGSGAIVLGGGIRGGGLNSGVQFGFDPMDRSAINWATNRYIPVGIHFQNVYSELLRNFFGYSPELVGQIFPSDQFRTQGLGLFGA